jgi:gliding motility-associated lipoprotein GldH|tara:strand:+ start:115 stop:576 length:462 start_codon:yes stop_codon:yes gene_type:complete
MKRVVVFSSIIVALTACDTNVVFEENRAMNDFVWNSDSTITFEVNIEDTLSKHNMYFNLRNQKSYDFSNLYVYYKSRLPNGANDLDTLHFILADPSGKWRGKGSGELINNQILFKMNFRFPMSGKYIFIMEQGMRRKELKGIADVGLRVEKVE